MSVCLSVCLLTGLFETTDQIFIMEFYGTVGLTCADVVTQTTVSKHRRDVAVGKFRMYFQLKCSFQFTEI